MDIPLHVDDTAPKAVAEFEDDGRESTLELQTPSRGIRQSIEAESVTLAARADASTDQANTAVTSTGTEVEDVAIHTHENAQTDSTESNIIPIISQATSSSTSSSSSSSGTVITTLKPKTKRTNRSSYLSFTKDSQKLIKPIKHTKLTNPPPSPNDDTPTILPDTTTTTTTVFPHPGFSPQRLPGITYSPYDLTGCRSFPNITSDFLTIARTRLYSSVRIYGVDCSQVLHTLRAASLVSVSVSSPPLKLFLGIFSLSDLSSQLTTLISDIQTFAITENLSVDDVWTNRIDTISVGNELVNNGQATPAQVLDAVRTVRQVLRREGYTGPVVTVDTFVAVLRHPELCTSSEVDYCAVNVHPFFDGFVEAEQAGGFVSAQVRNLREVIVAPTVQGKSQGGTTDTKMEGEGDMKGRRQKRVVVTETGWPKRGNANYRAVPGRSEQKTAVDGIMKAWREGSQRGFEDQGDFEVFLFTAFDDGWKKADKNTFYAEQFWGIHDR